MAEINGQQAPKKTRKLNGTWLSFIAAVLIGVLVSVYILAGNVAERYTNTIKAELTVLRKDTDQVEKLSNSQESASFAAMRELLKNYEEKTPHIKSVVLGGMVSSEYRKAQDLDRKYSGVISDYQNLTDEYFDKVAKTREKEKPSNEQKQYLAEYAKRLEAVKKQRRQLEEGLK